MSRDQRRIQHQASKPNRIPKRGYPNTWFCPQPNTCLSLRERFINFEKELSLSIFSSVFTLLILSCWITSRKRIFKTTSLNSFCNFITVPCNWHSLALWTYTLRKPLEARGCIQMLIKKPCLTCGRNGIRTVELFEW